MWTQKQMTLLMPSAAYSLTGFDSLYHMQMWIWLCLCFGSSLSTSLTYVIQLSIDPIGQVYYLYYLVVFAINYVMNATICFVTPVSLTIVTITAQLLSWFCNHSSHLCMSVHHTSLLGFTLLNFVCFCTLYFTVHSTSYVGFSPWYKVLLVIVRHYVPVSVFCYTFHI